MLSGRGMKIIMNVQDLYVVCEKIKNTGSRKDKENIIYENKDYEDFKILLKFSRISGDLEEVHPVPWQTRICFSLVSAFVLILKSTLRIEVQSILKACPRVT